MRVPFAAALLLPLLLAGSGESAESTEPSASEATAGGGATVSPPAASPDHSGNSAAAAAPTVASGGAPRADVPPTGTPTGTPPGGAPPKSVEGGGYAGSAACRTCHEAEYAAWSGSHHDLAMQEATGEAVLGDFAAGALEADGITSTFHERDGKFFVRTEGPGGTPAEYEVLYTFGVTPLQQYLVAFPGGRLQALRQAWDSRPKDAGGQRWFHLSPGEKIAPEDQLHWTGLYQNWNLECASCHSTNLRKNYDAGTNGYSTTFSGIDVSCENCHGAGGEHVAWAAKASPPYAATDDKGLVVSLRRSPEETWRFADAGARFASQAVTPAFDRSAATARMNVCAPCHSRRSTITEDVVPGAPLDDSHRLALLTEPLYYPDGQQRNEVYTWGSFLQSKMHARGVVCSDCHDPHSAKTRADGNALCSQCHNPAVFDVKTHHFHEPGSKGAQCVECHMRPSSYMVIDARRDHSFRVPRPDLAVAAGSPDACSSCHEGRTPDWAAAAMDGWYGADWRKRPEYGSVLHGARTKGGLALPSLLALARDGSQPAIVRATAATLAEPFVRPDGPAKVTADVQALLADQDSLVRLAALGLVENFQPSARATAAAPLLSDPRRAVRIEAARLLANAPDADLSPEQRAARVKARQEYMDYLRTESDWPAVVVSLGDFQLREGRMDEAVASYQRALELDPRFAGAYVNLADAWRAQGKDKDGEELLRRGLALLPEDAGLHHALGLLLVRNRDRKAGVDELALAVKFEPDNARYAYVHAIGLQSTGRLDEALAALVTADQRNPYNYDILAALVQVNIELGRGTDAILPYAQQVAEILPDDEAVRDLIQRLKRGK
ncbi:MAG: tetratricopeptide repeat protein [Candidatus Binatia bacterium]